MDETRREEEEEEEDTWRDVSDEETCREEDDDDAPRIDFSEEEIRLKEEGDVRDRVTQINANWKETIHMLELIASCGHETICYINIVEIDSSKSMQNPNHLKLN